MISLIVAYDQAYGIGKDNDLLYHFPKDMKYFRTITTGTTMLMGKKTWDSLPEKLPKRKHIVLSRTQQDGADLTVSSLEEVLALQEDLMVIGGATVYELMLPHVDRMYVTYINECIPADTYVKFFAQHINNFSLTTVSHERDTNKLNGKESLISFLVYDRIK